MFKKIKSLIPEIASSWFRSKYIKLRYYLVPKDDIFNIKRKRVNGIFIEFAILEILCLLGGKWDFAFYGLCVMLITMSFVNIIVRKNKPKYETILNCQALSCNICLVYYQCKEENKIFKPLKLR